MQVRELLEKMVKEGASDLIIKVGAPPLFRVFGNLLTLEDVVNFKPADTEECVKEVLTIQQFDHFQDKLELDFAYEIEGLSRFRVNVFKQRGTIGLVFRRIPNSVPSIEELNLPQVVRDFALKPRGLVLVTGPAGCGKTTTLASLVDHRNTNEACHIISVEDPVEFLHQDKRAIVNQRQIGKDTNSFAEALKHVLRQDPDVIVIGDMRDLETISLAITAAETGHLVFANLHTTDAVSTIDRIIDVFPPHQQQQIRMQVSVNLIGIVSQLLVKKVPGPGRVPAFEVMVATSAVRNMIREGKTFQLPQLLQTQSRLGMCSLNQSLEKLVKDRVTTIEEALSLSL
jgi:twitching motility protein PilT